jgi:ketosteroid isomerase-like protein
MKHISLALALTLACTLAACASNTASRPDPITLVVDPFFASVATEDLAAAQTFLAPDAMVQAMFNPNGQNGAAHVRLFPATAYLGIISRNYNNIVFTNRRYSVADGGLTVWMEAQGELVVAATQQPYRNGYVFKLTINDGGRIALLQEWVNTVTLTQQGIAARPSAQ